MGEIRNRYDDKGLEHSLDAISFIPEIFFGHETPNLLGNVHLDRLFPHREIPCSAAETSVSVRHCLESNQPSMHGQFRFVVHPFSVQLISGKQELSFVSPVVVTFHSSVSTTQTGEVTRTCEGKISGSCELRIGGELAAMPKTFVIKFDLDSGISFDFGGDDPPDSGVLTALRDALTNGDSAR